MATWTLSASAGIGGYVSPPSVTVNEGETATITAYPYSGYVFDHWIREDLISYANPYMAIMYRNISITAFFKEVAPPPPVYTCPYCDAEFATEAELNYHISTVHVPVEFAGKITRMELEYDGARAGIPAYDIPQGKSGLIHVWGRNDMATSEKLGIFWVAFDPDGIVVEEYEDWEFGETGPWETTRDEHHFIGGRFPLDKAGTYIISVGLKMSPPPAYPTLVDTYYGTLCTVGVVVPEPEFRGFAVTEYVKK